MQKSAFGTTAFTVQFEDMEEALGAATWPVLPSWGSTLWEGLYQPAGRGADSSRMAPVLPKGCNSTELSRSCHRVQWAVPG